MAGRMGRPPKPEDERLSEKVGGLRFTPPEFDELCRRAMAARVSLREYCRSVIRRDLGVSGVKT